MIPIDKEVPLPHHKSVYPFAYMEVGDSFFTKKPRSAVAGSAYYWQHKLKTRYATRDVMESGVEGVRVWRTK